jgi:hypothetical protein
MKERFLYCPVPLSFAASIVHVSNLIVASLISFCVFTLLEQCPGQVGLHLLELIASSHVALVAVSGGVRVGGGGGAEHLGTAAAASILYGGQSPSPVHYCSNNDHNEDHDAHCYPCNEWRSGVHWRITAIPLRRIAAAPVAVR